MTTFADVSASLIAGNPLTQSEALALHNNPIAIAEQDPSAPVIATLGRVVLPGAPWSYDNSAGSITRKFRVFAVGGGSGGSWGGADYIGPTEQGYHGSAGGMVSSIVSVPVGKIATFTAGAGSAAQSADGAAPAAGGNSTVVISGGTGTLTAKGGPVPIAAPASTLYSVTGSGFSVLDHREPPPLESSAAGAGGHRTETGGGSETAGANGLIAVELLQ